MAELSEQLTRGSLQTLEVAATRRLQDALYLEASDRLDAAIYLFGFAVEMRLNAACYHLLGYQTDEPIGDRERKRMENDARSRGIMASIPHNLPGWGQYLIDLRGTKMGDPHLQSELMFNVSGLYQQWRPRMRYRALFPSVAQHQICKEAALWHEGNYNRLWS